MCVPRHSSSARSNNINEKQRDLLQCQWGSESFVGAALAPLLLEQERLAPLLEPLLMYGPLVEQAEEQRRQREAEEAAAAAAAAEAAMRRAEAESAAREEAEKQQMAAQEQVGGASGRGRRQERGGGASE